MSTFYRSEAEIFLSFTVEIAHAPGAKPGECVHHELADVDEACRGPVAAIRDLGAFAKRYGTKGSGKIECWTSEGLAPGYREIKGEIGVRAECGINTARLREQIVGDLPSLVFGRDAFNVVIAQNTDGEFLEAATNHVEGSTIYVQGLFVAPHLRAVLQQERKAKPRPEVTLVDDKGVSWRYPASPNSRAFDHPDREARWVDGKLIHQSRKGEPHIIIESDDDEGERKVRMHMSDWEPLSEVMGSCKQASFKVRPLTVSFAAITRVDLWELLDFRVPEVKTRRPAPSHTVDAGRLPIVRIPEYFHE